MAETRGLLEARRWRRHTGSRASHRIHHLAVYGTLRRGTLRHAQYDLPRALVYAGRRWIRGVLFTLGTYPALGPGDGAVEVELYRVRAPAVLATLDAYEGFDAARPAASEYLRLPTVVALGPHASSPPCLAWVYWYNRPTAELAAIPHWPPPRR